MVQEQPSEERFAEAIAAAIASDALAADRSDGRSNALAHQARGLPTDLVDASFTRAMHLLIENFKSDPPHLTDVLVGAEQFVNRAGSDRFSVLSKRLVSSLLRPDGAFGQASVTDDRTTASCRAFAISLAQALGIVIPSEQLKNESSIKQFEPFLWLDLVIDIADEETFLESLNDLLQSLAFDPGAIVPRLKLIVQRFGVSTAQAALDLISHHLRSHGKVSEANDLLARAEVVEPRRWRHLSNAWSVDVDRRDGPYAVLAQALGAIPVAVCLFGPDGRLLFRNSHFIALWGLDGEVVQPGIHISEIEAVAVEAASDNPWPHVAPAITGHERDRGSLEFRIERQSGIIVKCVLSRLEDGVTLLSIVEETADVRLAEAKEENRKLQNADRLKNDFIRHLAYELRSPLTNIIGFTELLSLPQVGNINEKQREYLDHIGSSSAGILTMINDVLDLSQFDSDLLKLSLVEISISSLLEATVEFISERANEHSILIEVDHSRAPASFIADQLRVRQVLHIISSNALSFAPEGSKVSLSCKKVATGIQFSVHNEGPALPQRVIDDVFRKLDSQRLWRWGAGIGLSIAKRIMELHGGAMSITTHPLRGMTIYCQFPLHAGQQPSEVDGPIAKYA